MQKILLVLLVGIIGMSSTCSKTSASGDDQSYLIGTWKLSEQYNDIGNGTGDWQPYSGELRQFTFDSDGTFSSTSPLQNKTYNRYRLLDEKTIQFYNEGQQDSVKHHFEYKSEKLTIWLQCIEECKIKLVRSQAK